jgi:DNA modification methylase
MRKEKKKDTQEQLIKIQEESQKQTLPEQKRVFSVSEKIRKRVHNLPDPTRPPLGYDEHKAFDRVFPYIRLPRLHPPNHGDTVIFNAPEQKTNQLVLGDNLEVLRTISSESIDLIYIDPPFFSGRTYNVIWGDTNEVRTFYDIWEGGIDSYLIWLNARLWEIRRVLKKTGSIYVHCDWHASHYIKSEMDKIFGYDNFRANIVWCYKTREFSKRYWNRKHDDILFYSKTDDYIFKWNEDGVLEPYSEVTVKKYKHRDEKGYYRLVGRGITGSPIRSAKDVDPEWEITHPELVTRDYLRNGYAPSDYFIMDILNQVSKERIGYPTQKPEALLERIIKASSNEGDVVTDFFCGGGTTLAVAMKLKRKFVGCDSSRIAVSVTLDRLVKLGEEMSGVKSNISKEKIFQLGLVHDGYTIKEKVPNIEVYYLGVYPIDKFTNLDQESFIDFVLTCYGASHNTAEGVANGYKAPGQQEPILIGPANPNDSIDAKTVKAFFDEIKARLEVNKLIRAKIIGWRFNRQVIEYIKILKKYIEDNQLPMEIDLIPLDSREFRKRILQRYQDFDEAEFYLRFSKPPIIGNFKAKKIGPLEYEFEAIDTFSSNDDGYLVNCQWDFDYQVGHFSADKEYILSRMKVKPKGRDERFEAILTAKHKFDKEGEYTVACKVQDNLAGETILAKKITVD